VAAAVPPSETRYYNGFTDVETFNMNSLSKLGVEQVKPFFTRGVLVDMVAFRGRNMNLGEAIKPADPMGALQRQGIAEASFKPGGANFFRTGWSEQHWIKNNAEYNAKWIAQKQLCVVGADTWLVEVVPDENPNLPFICHPSADNLSA